MFDKQLFCIILKFKWIQTTFSTPASFQTNFLFNFFRVFSAQTWQKTWIKIKRLKFVVSIFVFALNIIKTKLIVDRTTINIDNQWCLWLTKKRRRRKEMLCKQLKLSKRGFRKLFTIVNCIRNERINMKCYWIECSNNNNHHHHNFYDNFDSLCELVYGFSGNGIGAFIWIECKRHITIKIKLKRKTNIIKLRSCAN